MKTAVRFFNTPVLVVLLCAITIAKARAQQITVKGDTLILSNGSKFWLNQEVTLGNGSAPDKTFNFIYEPEILYLKKRKPLSAGYYAKKAVIKKFQRDGPYKKSYSYNIIVLDFGDSKKFWCDVQGALDNFELVAPSPLPAPSDGKDAKLARLKKLYDSGDITKDEYETLKARILNSKETPTDKKNAPKPIIY